jgi:hypothetical protein
MHDLACVSLASAIARHAGEADDVGDRFAHLSDDQKQELTLDTGASQDIRMLTLARFRLALVLLHLLAMSGDRCVRFDVAGIIRDLSCGSRDPAYPKT